MLTRPDFERRAHVQLYADNKPAAEPYAWLPGDDCAVMQYTKQFGYHFKDENLKWISDLARQEPHTWGALAQRMRNS